MLRCDSVAPFGNPVVPLVYWMLIGSCRRARPRGGEVGAAAGRAAPPSRRRRRTLPRSSAGAGAADLVDHRPVVARPKARRRHEPPAAGLLQHELQLARAVRRVDRHQHDADPRGRELRQRPLGAVRRPDPDAVARLQAGVEQRPARARRRRRRARPRSTAGRSGRRPAPRAPACAPRSRRSAAPIVSSSSGTSVGPAAYDRARGAPGVGAPILTLWTTACHAAGRPHVRPGCRSWSGRRPASRSSTSSLRDPSATVRDLLEAVLGRVPAGAGAVDGPPGPPRTTRCRQLLHEAVLVSRRPPSRGPSRRRCSSSSSSPGRAAGGSGRCRSGSHVVGRDADLRPRPRRPARCPGGTPGWSRASTRSRSPTLGSANGTRRRRRPARARRAGAARRRGAAAAPRACRGRGAERRPAERRRGAERWRCAGRWRLPAPAPAAAPPGARRARPALGAGAVAVARRSRLATLARRARRLPRARALTGEPHYAAFSAMAPLLPSAPGSRRGDGRPVETRRARRAHQAALAGHAAAVTEAARVERARLEDLAPDVGEALRRARCRAAAVGAAARGRARAVRGGCGTAAWSAPPVAAVVDAPRRPSAWPGRARPRRLALAARPARAGLRAAGAGRPARRGARRPRTRGRLAVVRLAPPHQGAAARDGGWRRCPPTSTRCWPTCPTGRSSSSTASCPACPRGSAGSCSPRPRTGCRRCAGRSWRWTRRAART